ncbi:hypothetical protein BsIDN1_14010 [Bacillus safensis]|uniref:Uncharacterized protein n=1 Tax=Bacillus safensis TaxID=561879 RepID=A0A5S9M3R4_BACIA|nr:hypothetical protein BsIDN1_14010 [Bacillus safensis]
MHKVQGLLIILKKKSVHTPFPVMMNTMDGGDSMKKDVGNVVRHIQLIRQTTKKKEAGMMRIRMMAGNVIVVKKGYQKSLGNQ